MLEALDEEELKRKSGGDPAEEMDDVLVFGPCRVSGGLSCRGEGEDEAFEGEGEGEDRLWRMTNEGQSLSFKIEKTRSRGCV